MACVISLLLSLGLNAFWLYQMTSGERLIIKKSELDEFRTLIERYQEVEKLSQYVENYYYKPVEAQKLTEGMMKGLFSALNDPYSEFMDAETYARYEENVSGKFPGIGIYYEPNIKGQMEILSTIKDTPAFHAGLMSKDVIVAIDGKTFNPGDFEQMVSALKGEVGTKVKISVYRPSMDQNFELTLVRDIIDIEVTQAEKLDENTGYLKLISFDESSYKEVKAHLNDFEKKGLKNLILDLRQNPGGYLDAAVEISDLFLNEGVIVTTKSRAEGDEVFEASSGKFDFNLVVLIDGGSASAAEIVTAALKEHGVATVIGETSFGKGLVQEFRPYTKSRGFKLTTAQYFTPKGNSIQGIGINPDFDVPQGSGEVDQAILKAKEVFLGK